MNIDEDKSTDLVQYLPIPMCTVNDARLYLLERALDRKFLDFFDIEQSSGPT